ncbi:alpha/beta hydrolase [Rhodococcus sp. UNC363MFTsu5.1]|uniref:alpha/beta hydrolase n=1 Tax=Rhodococcus sp. UNC363MFTsu5.1 TaxID=1449069 RepID=UPI0009DFD103|nr:alpha/beta hydrolase [Rhodococcus sp. UNC363MFTsu5.1]
MTANTSPSGRSIRRARTTRSPRIAVAAEPRFIAGASLRSRILAESVRFTVKPALEVWARWPSAMWPAGALDFAARMVPPGRGVGRRRIRLEHCDAEWLQARDAMRDAVVLYLHGGGFLTCGLNTHRNLVSRISGAAGAPVLAVDYRMLPKHPIDAAIADGVAGYRWLLEQGFEGKRIVIAGDSAGGYLTFATAIAIAELGLPTPAGLVALSPLTDIDPATKLAHPGADGCPLIPRSVLLALADVAAARAGANSRTSPVNGVLAGLPPVLIHVGSTEILYPDAELMAQRLGAAGVSVTLEVWDRQVHVFHAAAGLIPEAERAIARVGEFIRTCTPAAEAPALTAV